MDGLDPTRNFKNDLLCFLCHRKSQWRFGFSQAGDPFALGKRAVAALVRSRSAREGFRRAGGQCQTFHSHVDWLAIVL